MAAYAHVKISWIPTSSAFDQRKCEFSASLVYGSLHFCGLPFANWGKIARLGWSLAEIHESSSHFYEGKCFSELEQHVASFCYWKKKQNKWHLLHLYFSSMVVIENLTRNCSFVVSSKWKDVVTLLLPFSNLLIQTISSHAYSFLWTMTDH